jgi:hypothetical protein
MYHLAVVRSAAFNQYRKHKPSNNPLGTSPLLTQG